jgi:hypothetical protein
MKQLNSISAKKLLAEHLFRGAVGISSLWYAVQISKSSPFISLIFGITTFVAFRGCPVCWTSSLFIKIRKVFK